MTNLKQRLRTLEEAATGRSLNIPTLADFYAAMARGDDPDTFGVGRPLSHFYGGCLPVKAGRPEAVVPHARTVN